MYALLLQVDFDFAKQDAVAFLDSPVWIGVGHRADPPPDVGVTEFIYRKSILPNYRQRRGTYLAYFADRGAFIYHKALLKTVDEIC